MGALFESHLTSECSPALHSDTLKKGARRRRKRRRSSVWRKCLHRVAQKVFLCKIVLSVCSIYQLGFWTSQRRLVLVHLLSTLLVDQQMDRSIKSTPGGVLEGLWAECNGYRTLTEEGRSSYLGLFYFILNKTSRNFFPHRKMHIQTFSAHAAITHITKIITSTETMFVSNIFFQKQQKNVLTCPNNICSLVEA